MLCCVPANVCLCSSAVVTPAHAVNEFIHSSRSCDAACFQITLGSFVKFWNLWLSWRLEL